MDRPNKIQGRPRAKLKSRIRSMEHQQKKYDSLSEVELLKLTDLKKELNRKV